MTSMRACPIIFIVVGLLAVSMTCEAFVARPGPMQHSTTELRLKQTVPQRIPFSKGSNKSENAGYNVDVDEEDVYHRRMFHFTLSEAEQKRRQKPTKKKFGWDHGDFARYLDP